MQHNNNNVIANELNTIILSLADTDAENISVSLEVIEHNISHLEKFSQEMSIPELRALTHWMMLNIELDDKNKEQITSLLEDGSYYNWMEVLSMLLENYDQSLLPIIYKKLTEPNWLVKPSAPLLRNLASWIESARASADSDNTVTNKDLIKTDEGDTNEQSSTEFNLSPSLDLEFTNKHIFEKVEPSILEKNYEDTSTLEQFNQSMDSSTSEIITEKTNNYYDDIEEKTAANPAESLFSESNETAPIDTTQETDIGEVAFNDGVLKSTEDALKIPTETTNDTDDGIDDFSVEVDDIVMTLTTICSGSDDPLINHEEYIAELQRFDMLAEISGYSPLIPISNWCQKNLSLFSKNPSDNLRQFVETGECWTWLELTKLSIAEPDELSTISELNSELNRDEWLAPIAVEDLESLILFLQDPAGGQNESTLIVDATTSEITIEPTKDIVEPNDKNAEKYSNLSFKWDEDTHPELLEVYFEETTENITLITEYLSKFGTTEAKKEQRQDARRIAHTIKGGSAVVGITALSTYAYQLEKILDYGIDHQFPTEAHALLHSASSCIESLYSAIRENKSVPSDFSTILSKLINYADTVEDLDDEPLELIAPALPDFITQQNAVNSAEKETEINEAATATTKEESNITTDVVEVIDDKVETKTEAAIEDTVETEAVDNKPEIMFDEAEAIEEVALEDSIEEVIADEIIIDVIEEPEEAIEEIKETSLPTLDQSDDLSDFTAELDDIVMTLVTTKVEAEKKPFKLDAYIEELQRLDMLAEISGYPEIVTVSNWYQNNLKLIAKKGTKKLGQFITSGESWTWLELVSTCIANPEDISQLSDLSTELTREDWVEALEIESLQALLLSLRSTETSTENIEATNHLEDLNETVESVEVINNIITWDDDVHPELLSVYLQETSEQITLIAKLLHLISKGKANKEQQEHAARIAHTIKGASGVVGINEIVDFTHKLEDILDYAVNNKIPVDTAELLAESSDCLESLFEAVQEKAATPEEYEPVLAKLTAYAEIIASDITDIEDSMELGMPELPDFITNPESNDSKDKSKEKKSKTKITAKATKNTNKVVKKPNKKGKKLAQKASPKILAEKSSTTPAKTKSIVSTDVKQTVSLESSAVSATEAYIRVPTALINKLLNIAGELVTTSSQVSDKVEKTLDTSSQIKDQDLRVHKMLDELSSTIYKQEKDQMIMLSSMQNKDFDTLEMDTYNELHSVAGLLTESILDSESIESTLKQQLNAIHDDLRLLDNLNKELSETILNSRMESLNTLIPRLERIVRQTCRKTKKEADLIVTGNDINIDTEILNGLVDPLLHLLRNSVDHGIETPKARKAKKKSPTGKIHLDFSRQGNYIQMQLTDDGAGIDSEKIYQHAINKGLITPDQEFSKSEVLKLILQPGFSTQKNVTDISGRGVGMDIVNKGIEALKGSLTMNSKLGKGSSFTVKIPLTLVTSSTLLVETAGNKVAIPTDSIEQLYYLSPEDVINHKDEKFIRHEGKEIVIESLAGILGWSAEDVDFTKAQTLLLVKGSQQLHAVYIDQIIHSREVVIKNLSHFIDGTKGVIGACHLSDGAVAPVMNLPQLLSLGEESNYVVKQMDISKINAVSTNDSAKILVVDDSLSNRKALSLIIDKTEYDVITAVDGLDALSVMNEQHVDLVFTDLEMPRMTGLELTQAIRAWDEKKNIPIVMVTSRSTNKHRELAIKAGVDDYLTKPVGTDTLLESIEMWLKKDAVV